MSDSALWSEVTGKVQNLGAEIANAFQRIEKANPRSLAGEFGDGSWANKDRAAEEVDEDPKRGAMTQIVGENTPPGLHKIVPDIVALIDAFVAEVAYTGSVESDVDGKRVRRELRTAPKEYGLPIKGDLSDRTYEYVRENC